MELEDLLIELKEVLHPRLIDKIREALIKSYNRGYSNGESAGFDRGYDAKYDVD